jgi:hypothetical protein
MLRGGMKRNINMYLNPSECEKVETLLKILVEQGYNLLDQRGYPSISALFRYLVDEKLKALETAPTRDDSN